MATLGNDKPDKSLERLETRRQKAEQSFRDERGIREFTGGSDTSPVADHLIRVQAGDRFLRFLVLGLDEASAEVVDPQIREALLDAAVKIEQTADNSPTIRDTRL